MKLDHLSRYVAGIAGIRSIVFGLGLLENSCDDRITETVRSVLTSETGTTLSEADMNESHGLVEAISFYTGEAWVRMGCRLYRDFIEFAYGGKNGELTSDSLYPEQFGAKVRDAQKRVSAAIAAALDRLVGQYLQEINSGKSVATFTLVVGDAIKVIADTPYPTVEARAPVLWQEVLDSLPRLVKRVRENRALRTLVEIFDRDTVYSGSEWQQSGGDKPAPALSGERKSVVTVNGWTLSALHEMLRSFLEDLARLSFEKREIFDKSLAYTRWMRRARLLLRMNLAVSATAGMQSLGVGVADEEMEWDWRSEFQSREIGAGHYGIALVVGSGEPAQTPLLLGAHGPWSKPGGKASDTRPEELIEVPELLAGVIRRRLDDLEALPMPFHKKLGRAAHLRKAQLLLERANGVIRAQSWWPKCKARIEASE